MNVNIFFVIVAAGLMSIFLFFKPLHIKQRKFVDVPVFELGAFTMYELDTQNLITVMTGTKATRYSNRYEVSNINYTDNSKDYLANMKADRGLFKDEVVYLNGNVDYQREDGLVFKTQKATYNKKTKVASTDTDYISYMGDNEIVGTSLRYNSFSKRVKSKNIVARYQLKEDNK